MRTIRMSPTYEEETVRLLLPSGDYLDVTILAEQQFRLRSCTRLMGAMRITPEVSNTIKLKI